MISKSAPTRLHTIFQGNLDWEEKVHTTTLISKYTADTPGMTVPLTGAIFRLTLKKIKRSIWRSERLENSNRYCARNCEHFPTH